MSNDEVVKSIIGPNNLNTTLCISVIGHSIFCGSFFQNLLHEPAGFECKEKII